MKYRIVHDSYRDRFKVEVKGKLWGWNLLSFAGGDTCGVTQPPYGFIKEEHAREFVEMSRRQESKEKLKNSPNRYTVVEII